MNPQLTFSDSSYSAKEYEKEIITHRVQEDLTEHLYNKTYNGIKYGFFAVILPIVAFWSTIPHLLLLSWGATFIISCFVTIKIYKNYIHQNKKYASGVWQNKYYTVFFVFSALWGIFPVIWGASVRHLPLYSIENLSDPGFLLQQAVLIAIIWAVANSYAQSIVGYYDLCKRVIPIIIGPLLFLFAILSINCFYTDFTRHTCIQIHDLCIPLKSFGLWYAMIVVTGYIYLMYIIQINGENSKSFIDRLYSLNSENLATFQATHDLVTKLPNIKLLSYYADMSIKKASLTNSNFGLVFFTINLFSQIAAKYGLDKANLAMLTFAERFIDLIDKRTTSDAKTNYKLCQVNLETFGLLIFPLQKKDVKRTINEFMAIFDEPIKLDKNFLSMNVKVGVCMYPEGATTVDTLISGANVATFFASEEDEERIHYFGSTKGKRYEKHVEMVEIINHAIRHDGLFLIYQPLVDITTGKLCGAEALVRLRTQQLGIIVPDDFLPVADATSLMPQIDRIVIRKTLEQYKKWEHKVTKDFKIAINLSASAFRKDVKIVDYIRSTIEKIGVSPNNVEFELTESTAFEVIGLDEVSKVLQELKTMGFHIVMDDYGTGNSNIAYIKRLFIEKIKIDKIFIKNIEDETNKAIIKLSISLAKELNLDIVVEGVETLEQINYLKQLGFNYLIQGYYISRPIEAEEFGKFIDNGDSLLFR